MKRNTRRRWIGMLSLGLIAVAAIVVVLTVFAGTNDDRFTATGYSDVIRFQADGVATLQVRIFDLSGKEVWDSGMVSGDIVDWDRRNDTGERLAYGAYIYSAQGWNASGDLNFQKNGKLALMPGDTVQLQAAPVVTLPQSDDGLAPFRDEPFTFQPMAVNVDHSTESWAFGQVGIGTTDPMHMLSIIGQATNNTARVMLQSGLASMQSFFQAYTGGIFFAANGYYTNVWNQPDSSKSTLIFQVRPDVDAFIVERVAPGGDGTPAGSPLMWILGSGRMGLGITNPAATLEVHGSATNLLALYDSAAPANPLFRVTKTGEVRADGAYYGASFNTGSADVAERINVSEWVEAGCVVEIDPKHPGFFRKSFSPYSTKVAGIISTSPGVILGNSFDEATDDWEDNRPVLAIAGRVPLQVTAENGPIQIGDLLVSSSIPGYAMRCDDPQKAVGAVVGKAMELLEVGTGTIVVQVMLR